MPFRADETDMMRKNYIQNKIATSRITLPVAAVITILSWLTMDCSWTVKAICCIVAIACSYFLIVLNTTYSLVRTRNQMGSAILLLSLATKSPTELFPADIGLMLIFLISLYMLLGTRQDDRQKLPLLSFQAFLFLSIGILIHPATALLLIPYLIAMSTFLRAWTLRSATAAILGLCTPFWFLLGWYLITWNTFIPQRFVELVTKFSILTGESYQNINPAQWLLTGALLFIGCCSVVHYLRTKNYDKVHARMLLNTLVLIEIFLAIGIGVLPHFEQKIQPLLLVVTSLLTGHYFTLDKSKTTLIIFIIFISALFLLIFLNIWNNLSLMYQTY